jgi:hypothetical protein
MVDPPRLHNKLGANWVEVTKTVFGGVQRGFLQMRAKLENAASNTRS